VFQPRTTIEPVARTPEMAPTVERGKYLARTVANCVGCHTKRDPISFAAVSAEFSGGAEMEPASILEHLRMEAERLFDARAELLPAGSPAGAAPAERAVIVPVRVRGEEIAALRLARGVEVGRVDVARAALLADLAGRVYENARLRAEAQVREGERARLSDQLITAEQEERRRIALFLHDGPVQSMSGIALMLDAVIAAIEGGRTEEATRVLSSALEKQRETIRSLRDLSFELEPVVLRDQGFGPAVRALSAP